MRGRGKNVPEPLTPAGSIDKSILVSGAATAFGPELVVHAPVLGSRCKAVPWPSNDSAVANACCVCLHVCIGDRRTAFVALYARARGYLDLPKLNLIYAVVAHESTG